MSDDVTHDPAHSAAIIPFPLPLQAPRTFEKTSGRLGHEGSLKAENARAKRRRCAQLLVGFPAVMAQAFEDLRPASIASWRADIEVADDDEFLLAEIFLSRFCKIRAFTHTSSYTLKHLCEEWHGYLGLDGVYVSNGVLIAVAISFGFRAKCIPGTPNAIFNISKAELNFIRRLVKEHRASTCPANLRGADR